MSGIATEVTMQRRPEGALKDDDFAFVERSLPAIAEGEVLVENHWMSVDPYMRLYLTEQSGAHAPLQVGETLHGGAVGIVVESRAKNLPVGAAVQSMLGFRDRFVAHASELIPVDANLAPLQSFLGVLGLTGLTAYGGTYHLLKPQAGETIYVNGAAGAVGSLVVQLAKRRGATVLASAGSDAKGAWVTDALGADSFINYRSDDLSEKLAEYAPDGLNMMFDNVGGGQLEAAIEAMAPMGRIALCGAIELYDSDNYRRGPANLFTTIERNVTLFGFNAGQFRSNAPAIVTDLAGMLARGEIVNEETIVVGFDNCIAAFRGVLAGENTGKMLVQIKV